MDLSETADGIPTRRHPWEAARAWFFLELITRLRLDHRGAQFLDVGAGDAWFAQQMAHTLPPQSTVTCWDINYSHDQLEGLDHQGHRLAFIRERPQRVFEGVLMLDVIEHVHDDLAFLTDIVRNLMSPSGWLLFSVPAYQALYTRHDEILRHYRRYSPAAGRALLHRAGLRIEAQGGLFHGLLAVRGAQALVERFTNVSKSASGIGAWRGGTLVTRLVTAALRSEARLSLELGVGSPLTAPGLSYWAVCSRDEL